MASVLYNSFLNDLAKGNIDLDTDTFKVMLVTSPYTEDKDAHSKRSSITDEVSGTGYTAGGAAVTVTVSAIDTTNDRQEAIFAAVTWAASTITARKAVIYKSRGGASSADELVACIDFGSDVISVAGNLTVSASTIRFQN
jgi:hypothetical protein